MNCILRNPLLSVLLVLGASASFAMAQLAEKKMSDAERSEFVKETARKIDGMVARQLKRDEVKAQPKVNDEQFLRRIYLSIVGRIPDFSEATAFLDDEDEDKRAKLVSSLLKSEGFVSNFTNWWTDLLRVKTRIDQYQSGVPYLIWIRDSILENKPYDKMVHELLTASGPVWEEGNGAVAYYERDRGMPLDNMAITTRVFLGARTECSQCHDDPFDDEWKQKDFYEMAAFTHGVTNLKTPNGMKDVLALERAEGTSQKMRNVSRLLRQSVMEYGVEGPGEGAIKLPKDYQYKDGDPGEVVGGRTKGTFGKTLRNSRAKKMDDGRQRFADWMTSPKNTSFSKVIANRMWKFAFGTAQFEPVDNLKKTTVFANPDLMVYLEKTMKDVKYDLRTFLEIIYTTHTFQLGPYPDQRNPKALWNAQGRLVQRLSGEQVWDSLLSLTIPDPDDRHGLNYTPLVVYRGKVAFDGKKTMYDVYKEIKDLRGEAFWKYAEDFYDELQSAGRPNGEEMAMMTMSMSGAESTSMEEDKSSLWAGFKPSLLRASELPVPMSPGHFLRMFGQSGRDVVEGSTKESDVTQALSLLNGQVQSQILNNRKAVIFKTLDEFSDPEKKIEALYLSILTRKPTIEEVDLLLGEVAMNPDTAYANIIWALTNSSEFLFLQ